MHFASISYVVPDAYYKIGIMDIVYTVTKLSIPLAVYHWKVPRLFCNHSFKVPKLQIELVSPYRNSIGRYHFGTICITIAPFFKRYGYTHISNLPNFNAL